MSKILKSYSLKQKIKINNNNKKLTLNDSKISLKKFFYYLPSNNWKKLINGEKNYYLRLIFNKKLWNLNSSFINI